MKTIRFWMFFYVLFCGAQGTFIFDSILVNSQFRKFRLYVPNSYTGQVVPLIFNFHGYTSNSQQQLLYTNFMSIADTAKFLVVYPEGTPDMYNNLFFNAGIVTGNPDDVAFTLQLINHLIVQYNINPNRIYSCGMSNGGFMSYYLSCMLPGKFAAIGSVTGSNFVNWYSCQPGRVFPVMQIHGTNDPTVPYSGNSSMVPIDSVINKYRILCNLPNVVQTYSFANISYTDNCTAVSYRYVNNSSQKIMVELIKVFGGAHTWPGGTVNFPGTCYDFNASVELWRFFRQHTLSDYLTGWSEYEKQKNVFKIYPNPCSEYFQTEDESVTELELISVDGKVTVLSSKDRKFFVRNLTSGIYVVRPKGFNGMVKLSVLN